jgi:endonuclease III
MNAKLISEKLVARGLKLFDAPKQLDKVKFTHVPEADVLLKDLEKHPHAFVLACVMDRQIKAERAWVIPYRFSQNLGGFSIEKLKELSLPDVYRIMSQPEPLHRFVDTMSKYFYSAIQRISNKYSDDASRIWAGNPSSAEVVFRFLEFDGVGPKIATITANILARDFKIPFADHFSIDISADVHICRVFARLELSATDASVEQIIYKARALYPNFPGIMDLPCWEIGRNYCKASNPDCGACYMNDLCPTAIPKGLQSFSPGLAASVDYPG